MKELLIQFLTGGAVVSSFAMLGDICPLQSAPIAEKGSHYVRY